VSEPEKPLHVRVADVLGWSELSQYGFNLSKSRDWDGIPPGRPSWDRCFIPDYDLNWNATGPLIERFGIGVWKDWPTSIDPWTAHADKGDAKEYGATALLAVCNLIVANPQHFSLDSRA
jgi:hypothetical protein